MSGNSWLAGSISVTGKVAMRDTPYCRPCNCAAARSLCSSGRRSMFFGPISKNGTLKGGWASSSVSRLLGIVLVVGCSVTVLVSCRGIGMRVDEDHVGLVREGCHRWVIPVSVGDDDVEVVNLGDFDQKDASQLRFVDGEDDSVRAVDCLAFGHRFFRVVVGQSADWVRAADSHDVAVDVVPVDVLVEPSSCGDHLS